MNNSRNPASAVEQLKDQALCRSVLYGALSLALYTPTRETILALRSTDATLALADAAFWLTTGELPADKPPEAAPHQTAVALRARVADWIQTLESLTLDRLRSAHGRCFGHTARGPVCPYETEYGQAGLFEQPRRLAQIMGFYQAFGLAPRLAERERPDHVSCELEFADFLSRKEAVALEAGDEAMLAETRKATRLFLKEHLGCFGRAFARLLREQDPEGFFGKVGDVLFDFLTLECRRLRIEPGSPLLALRSAEEDNVPMACGEQCAGDSELVQLETPK